jgi:hypothetical protein
MITEITMNLRDNTVTCGWVTPLGAKSCDIELPKNYEGDIEAYCLNEINNPK